MSTVYTPVLITSQDQANALPDGTVATLEGRWPRILLRDGDHAHWAAGDHTSMTPADMTGWTALVPVEANAEHSAWDGDVYMGLVSPPTGDDLGYRLRVRYTTPWEDA